MKNIPYFWIILFALFFICLASNGFGFNTLPLWYPSLTSEFNLVTGTLWYSLMAYYLTKIPI